MDQVVDSTTSPRASNWQVDYTSCFEENNDLCEIEEGLFLGSLADANNKDALKSSSVTHILTVANISVCTYPNDFVYKAIAVTDRENTNIAQYFDECFNFIDKAKSLGGGVLVHCAMGISRSVTIVVAYLMKKHDTNLTQALEHVKSRRPQANPNSGFISQLQDFKESLQVNEDEKTRLDHSSSLSLTPSALSLANKDQKTR